MEQGNNMNQNQPSEISPVADTKPGDNKMLMGILAYVSILVVIPYLVAKNDSFVKFHIKQGLVLVIIELAIWLLYTTVWILYPFLKLIEIAAIVLSIVGIVNVVQGREKELPLVGSFSKYFSSI